jgi:hypothetical protein
VVVIVAHARLIQRGSTGGLDPSDDARGYEGIEVVVNGLPRKRGQSAARRLDEERGRLVLALVLERLENGPPRSGQAHVRFPQPRPNLLVHVIDRSTFVWTLSR